MVEAERELCVVLEQRVLPRRAVTLAVAAVRQDRCAAADRGRAACCVADVHAVAEQLAEQLDIGRLGAACAGGGELEVGLCELNILDALVADDVLLEVAFVHCNVVEQRLLGLHLLERRPRQRVLCRARGQAHAAAEAVIRRKLHAEIVLRRVLAEALCRSGNEGIRNTGLLLVGQQDRTDCRVRAAHRAAVALDAGIGVPLRNLGRNAALGVDRGAVLPRAVEHAVLLEYGDRQLVALLLVERHDDVADERGHVLRLCDRLVGRVRPCRRDLDLDGRLNAEIDRLIVHVDDLLTGLLEVGIIVVLLHILDREVHRDDLGQREERALKDIVGALAEADGRRQLCRVDDVEVCVLAREVALHLRREMLLKLLDRPRAVEQEGAAVLEVCGDIVLFNVGRGVNRDKIRGIDQISAENRLVAKAQMALRQTAGLHRIVGEIRLRVLAADKADGRDGVLVRADRAVTAETPQLAADLARMRKLDLGVVERGVGNVVVDADGEVVLRLLLREVVVNRDELARGGVLGGQAVAAADDRDVVPACLIEGGHDVEVYRLADRTGLLAAVENSDLLDRSRDCRREMLDRERAVQVDLHHADLAALRVQIVNSLLDRLGSRAHNDDDFLCVRRAVVVEQLVVAAGQLVDLVHVVLDGVGHDGRLDVRTLLALEVDVGVYVVAAVGRVLRVERLTAELLERLLVDQAAQILIIEGLDALHLVRGTEAVEAVHERIARLDGGQMRDGGQVHRLLRRGGHQHAVAGGAAGHEVGVVTEDRVVVARDDAGRDVHDARQELAAHGVHRRDHQHQALRGGEGRGERARLQRAVAGAGRAGLRLHLNDVDRRAEQVFLALCGPFVDLFRHRRGRRDRVDRRYLGERIGAVRRRRVAVHNSIVLFVIHNDPFFCACISGAGPRLRNAIPGFYVTGIEYSRTCIHAASEE